MKKLIYIIVLITCFALPVKSHAADISNSGLSGTVLKIWETPDGKIRAVDTTGRIAEFNYVKWSITSQPPSGFSYGNVECYDPHTNKILIGNRIYDIDNHTWETAATNARLLWKGVQYRIGNTEEGASWDHFRYTLERFSEGSWQTEHVFTSRDYRIPSSNKSLRLNDQYRMDINGNVMFLGRYFVSSIDRYYTLAFNIESKSWFYTGNSEVNQWLNPIYSPYMICQRFTGNAIAFNHVTMPNVSTINYNSIVSAGAAGDTFNNFAMGQSIHGDIVTSIYRDMWEGTKVYVNSTELFSLDGNIRFSTYCNDKYGNMIFGGVNGRIIIRGPGGNLYVDSNIYTNYFVDDIKELTEEAKTAAEQARNAALASYDDINYIKNDILSVSGGIIQDNTGTVLDAARAARDVSITIDSKINDMAVKIDNISNIISPILEVKTLSGALATSGNSISAIVCISNSTNNEFTYSINEGEFSMLPSNRIVSLPVENPGLNPILVTVKDQLGNTTSKLIVIRKL